MNTPHVKTTPAAELRPEDVLSTEQLQRMLLVTHAGQTVRAQALAGVVSSAPDVSDVLRVATWTFKGTDPVDDWMNGHPAHPTATDGTGEHRSEDAAPSTPSSDR